MPKVSVIIPVYGVEKYIERCARSLFEQTLDDIEYIFVNDCTKDRSIEILKEVLLQYPKRQPQTRIVSMSINSGLPTVRKYGIQLATGDYLIHCDSDDWVEYDTYEKMYLKAIEDDYDMVFCNFNYSDGIHHRKVKHKFKNMSKEHLLMVLVQECLWSVCGTLVKRNVFVNNKIFYPIENMFEDLILMLQMLHYTSKYTYVEDSLYYYYHNLNSITQSNEKDYIIKKLNQACCNTDIAIKMINEYGFTDIIIILKLYCRAIISPLTSNEENLKMWYSIYPDIDKENLIFNRNIPVNLKINYFSVKIGIYSFLKKIQKYLRRILS